MLNFGWWRDKDNREGAVALSSVLKVAVPAVIAAGAIALGYLNLAEQPAAPPVVLPVQATGNTVSAGDNSPVNIGGTQTLTGRD